MRRRNRRNGCAFSGFPGGLRRVQRIRVLTLWFAVTILGRLDFLGVTTVCLILKIDKKNEGQR
jgi:hypothetical protein